MNDKKNPKITDDLIDLDDLEFELDNIELNLEGKTNGEIEFSNSNIQSNPNVTANNENYLSDNNDSIPTDTSVNSDLDNTKSVSEDTSDGLVDDNLDYTKYMSNNDSNNENDLVDVSDEDSNIPERDELNDDNDGQSSDKFNDEQEKSDKNNDQTKDNDSGNEKANNSSNENNKPSDDNKGTANDTSNKDNEKNDLNNKDNKNQNNDNLNKKDNNKNKTDSNNKDSLQKDNNINNNKNKPKNTEKKADNAAKKPNKKTPKKNKANRPDKNIKKAGDKARKGAKNTAKNAKNVGKKAADGIKKGAKTAGKAAKTAVKGAKAAGKAAVQAGKAAAQTLAKIIEFLVSNPVGWVILIILAVVAIIVVVVIWAGGLTTPGQGNDISSKFNQFSERDQKILEKINNEGGSKNNAELALFAVAYPYFEALQESTESYLTKDVEGTFVDDIRNDILDSMGCDQDCRELVGENTIKNLARIYAWDAFKAWISGCDTESLIEGTEELSDKCGDLSFSVEGSDNDPYLSIFRKQRNVSRYKTLLKHITGTNKGDYRSEKEFISFLKDTYMENYPEYKSLLEQTDDKEGLKNAMVEDIISNASNFSVYIKDVCNQNVSFQSAGQISADGKVGDIDIKEMLKSGNVYVDIKEPSCKSINYNTVKNCKSIEGSPFSLKEFSLGSAMSEIAAMDGTYDEEIIKAHIVTSKSFLLGHPNAMNPSHTSSGWRVEKTNDGKYIYTIRSSLDSSFCNIRTGCNLDGQYSRKALSPENQAKMDRFWEETKNFYVWDNKYGVPFANFYQSESDVGPDDDCARGACLYQGELTNYEGQTYDKILAAFYSQKDRYSFVTTETGDAYSAVVGSVTESCDGINGNGLGIPDDKFKFYYQLDYAHAPFCGASAGQFRNSCAPGSNSICSSGCGVTSFAMLISNLSNDSNFDPPKASDEARDNGGCAIGEGSRDSLFTQISKKHSGFTYKSLPTTLDGAQQAVQTIRDGGLVAANVQEPSPFTRSGHWILIRGLTEDGKVKVADPNNRDYSKNGKYNIEEFINSNWLNGHSWIAIYGPKSEEIKGSNDSEVLTNGTQKSYFAPIQSKHDISFGSSGSTSGCSNGNVSHDISNIPEGTKLYAGIDGTAYFKQTYCGSRLVSYGNRVEIIGSDRTSIIYAHLKDFPKGISKKIINTCTKRSDGGAPCPASSCSATTDVIATKQVKKGEYIGTLGDTGNSTGPHLHVEIHPQGSGSCVQDPWAAFGMR